MNEFERILEESEKSPKAQEKFFGVVLFLADQFGKVKQSRNLRELIALANEYEARNNNGKTSTTSRMAIPMSRKERREQERKAKKANKKKVK